MPRLLDVLGSLAWVALLCASGCVVSGTAGEGEGEGDVGDGWSLAFAGGGREVVSLITLEDDDVFVAVETSAATSIVADGVTIVEDAIARQGCIFLRVSSTGELRWHRSIAFADERLLFCSPVQRVGETATLVVPSQSPGALLGDDAELVAVAAGESPVLSIDFGDGAIDVARVLPSTSGGSVVRTGDGTEVTLRLANDGDVVLDFGTTSSVVFDDLDWMSTVGFGDIVTLETDVIASMQWNSVDADILSVPWDDGTTTVHTPSGLFGAVIARIGPNGVRWARYFESNESSASLHATEQGVVAVGHMSAGAMLDARTNATVAAFAPGSSSEGIVVELTNDGELTQVHELESTLLRPAALASSTSLWLLSETLPVGAGRIRLQRLSLDASFGDPLDIGDVVRGRRMSVAAIEGSVVLGLTLADASDVTTLVPWASLDGDVVLVRPDTARLP